MPPRVSPPRISPGVGAAPRPPSGMPGADAHRQTGFVLGGEVERILDGLDREGKAAYASSAAKHRTQLLAASLGLWSRSWLCRVEALHATQCGNYAAAFPLIRSAADYQAALIYILRQGGAEWHAWLEAGGIRQAADAHATEFRLHAFRAAEVLADHDILGPLYRAATDLSLSHFGTTLLLAGNESNPERLLLTFGDRDFHLGLAEISFGWLLQLGAAQFEALVEFATIFGIPEAPTFTAWADETRALVNSPARCTIRSIERDGERRYLVSNWRRASGAAPGRVLL